MLPPHIPKRIHPKKSFCAFIVGVGGIGKDSLLYGKGGNNSFILRSAFPAPPAALSQLLKILGLVLCGQKEQNTQLSMCNYLTS